MIVQRVCVVSDVALVLMALRDSDARSTPNCTGPFVHYTVLGRCGRFPANLSFIRVELDHKCSFQRTKVWNAFGVVFAMTQSNNRPLLCKDNLLIFGTLSTCLGSIWLSSLAEVKNNFTIDLEATSKGVNVTVLVEAQDEVQDSNFNQPGLPVNGEAQCPAY